MSNIEKLVAQKLLNIKAVSLDPIHPYTWASGLKSPIYCDNRLIISYPETRLFITENLVHLIQTHFSDVDVIAGTATAGIPHATLIAHLLHKPMIYVRSNNKDHGKRNAIEGELKPGQKVVMIEDLISTGNSVIQAAKLVEENGGKILGVVAIFNYLLSTGQNAFKKNGYPLVTLTNYLSLVEEALQDNTLKPYENTLKEWYQDPQKWSQSFNQQ